MGSLVFEFYSTYFYLDASKRKKCI